jgi:tRNA dimethylallyltransferase
VIAILGPTATGKSALAVRLARRFGGEIVSADSRQLYRGMDVGAGKISRIQMQGIPHHLLDVASPKRRWTVVQYEHAATQAVGKINGPVWLVGGSPFYVEAALYPGRLPNVPPNRALRKQLSRWTTSKLTAQLRVLDPERAAIVDLHNRVRIMRAVEIAMALGTVPQRPREQSPYRILKIGLRIPPPELKKRIYTRLYARMRAGMVAEVRRLHNSGLSWKALESFGLEYRFLALYLQGKLSKEEALNLLERAINAFTRRQMTWWKRDPEIHWIRTEREVTALTRQFLR